MINTHQYDQKIVFMLGIIIITALVGLTLYYTAHSSNMVAQSKRSVMIVSPTPTTVPNGWQTIQSNHLKFSLRYPASAYPFMARESENTMADHNVWRLSAYDNTKEENLEALATTSELLVRVLPYDHDIEYYRTVDYSQFFSGAETRTIIRDGVTGYVVRYTTPDNIYSDNALFVYDGRVYQISLASKSLIAFEKATAQFPQILSTIHFLK